MTREELLCVAKPIILDDISLKCVVKDITYRGKYIFKIYQLKYIMKNIQIVGNLKVVLMKVGESYLIYLLKSFVNMV